MTRWVNFLHIYQPPRWPSSVIRKVSREAYRPLVRFLLSHKQIKITLNISGSLTEQLAALPDQLDIVAGLRTLITRKQIEPTDSAMYHAILPLLPENEIIRQVKLNHAMNRRHFGPAYQPKGFFPPEMAYSPKLGSILSKLGYHWVMLDGISHPGMVDYATRSKITNTNLTALFRNRFMSDYLAFEATAKERNRFIETAQHWDGHSNILITAMDGENLGHHRHETKALWQSLVQLKKIKTVTASELIADLEPTVSVTARAASWSTQRRDLRRNAPFILWKNPSNPLHELQWKLFTMILKRANERERLKTLPTVIRKEVDETVASDWYWWASREPWWDVDIILNQATKLEVLGHEIGLTRPQVDEVLQLARDIMKTAQRWQATGAAKRHANRFLKSTPMPHYLGGARIHYRGKQRV